MLRPVTLTLPGHNLVSVYSTYLLHVVVGRKLFRYIRVELLLLAVLDFGTFHFHLLDPANIFARLQLRNQVDLLVQECLIGAAQALHAHTTRRWRAVALAKHAFVCARTSQLDTV